ncbi:MAG TPA: hypothetical protein VLJ59_06690 [Mycobacteriales bacterium]|nr:hypothetical protein [Mycobacteriales bacterium]
MTTTTFLGKAGVALAIGLVLGGGTAAGFGIASAVSDPTPTPAATSAPNNPSSPGNPGRLDRPDRPKAGAHPRLSGGLLARRIEHGELVIKGKDGKPVTMVVQRGQVTAVSSSSVTVKSDDGYTATYPIVASTKVRVNGDAKAIDGVTVGNTAAVLARKDGDTLTATRLIVRT